jgi:uncharacterized protein
MKGARLAGPILFLTFLVGGCGYKNPPVPPESVVPKPIVNLMHKVDSKGVELSWNYPVETIKGTSISEIDSFEIYRAVVPVEDYCGTCPIPFGEPVTLPGGTVAEDTVRKGTYQESLLRSGHKYFYKVRSRTSWWASSADSNIVSFSWHTPAKPPQGLKIDDKGEKLVLSWQPVTEQIDGSAIDMDVKYQVFRSKGGETYVALGEPQSATTFIDKKVQQGYRYFYKVQSLMAVQDDFAKGGVSAEANIVPKDMVPPPVVTGVTAVRTSSGIKVIWDGSIAGDIAGYKVYRRQEAQKGAALLGEVTKSYTIFVDEKVPEDTELFYSVTAFDQADPPNESKRSKEATLRH